jgi:lipopolysaccharide/colanic/teichoic acid biosynthesis glycosyltransferase
MSIYRNHLKRSVDVCVAAVVLLNTAPALLTLAIALKTRLASPVFFVQTLPRFARTTLSNGEIPDRTAPAS